MDFAVHLTERLHIPEYGSSLLRGGSRTPGLIPSKTVPRPILWTSRERGHCRLSKRRTLLTRKPFGRATHIDLRLEVPCTTR